MNRPTPDRGRKCLAVKRFTECVEDPTEGRQAHRHLDASPGPFDGQATTQPVGVAQCNGAGPSRFQYPLDLQEQSPSPIDHPQSFIELRKVTGEGHIDHAAAHGQDPTDVSRDGRRVHEIHSTAVASAVIDHWGVQ
jgi:hypothetical protein